MNSSLSLLLPVHNSQNTLHDNVHQVVEILPDLTNWFEILIIDDGSTDATCEIAYELARNYPQVLVNRNAKALGWAATIATKSLESRGDFLMIHDGGHLKTDDVVGLWRLRKGIAEAAAMRQSKRTGKLWRIDPKAIGHDAGRANPADQLGLHARAPGSNLLMIHRQQIGDLKNSLARLPNTGWPAASRSVRGGTRNPIKPPSFLTRAKNFALGE